MNKTYTREQIAKQLTDTQSAEFAANGVTYYFHDVDGTVFTASATPADYGWTQEQWDAMESPEEVYDRETLDDPTFAGIVDDLTEQVNAWLAEQ